MDEVLAHPAFPDTIWNLTPTKSGRLPVAADRGGPINIEWEVHGTGDIKLVVCVPQVFWYLDHVSELKAVSVEVGVCYHVQIGMETLNRFENLNVSCFYMLRPVGIKK